MPIGRDRNGKPWTYTQCGLLMHSSFVVTTEGLPLGLAAVQLWSRKAFKCQSALNWDPRSACKKDPLLAA